MNKNKSCVCVALINWLPTVKVGERRTSGWHCDEWHLTELFPPQLKY